MTLPTLNDSGASPSLDAKLACALSAMLSGEMVRAIIIMKEQLALEGKLVKGRQILFEVYKHFRVSEAEGRILDLRGLMQVKLNTGQLATLLNDGEYALVAMQMLPPESMFE